MMSKVSLLLILLFVVVFLGPLVTIWSLNTLFPVLAIPYSIETWLATAVIAGIIRGDGVSFKGK
jgi:formate hydrogenlyase subunit 4